MKQKVVRPSILTILGLLIITTGWVASGGLKPEELLIPVLWVITGLTTLTAIIKNGPSAFL